MDKDYSDRLISVISELVELDNRGFEYVRMSCEQEACLAKYAPAGYWKHGATNSLRKFANLSIVLCNSNLDYQYREMKTNPAHIDLTEIAE